MHHSRVPEPAARGEAGSIPAGRIPRFPGGGGGDSVRRSLAPGSHRHRVHRGRAAHLGGSEGVCARPPAAGCGLRAGSRCSAAVCGRCPHRPFPGPQHLVTALVSVSSAHRLLAGGLSPFSRLCGSQSLLHRLGLSDRAEVGPGAGGVLASSSFRRPGPGERAGTMCTCAVTCPRRVGFSQFFFSFSC